MEILFITHKYPPSIGGMENQSFHLIKGVSAEAKVHKIVFDGKGSVFSFYLSLKRKVKRILSENPGIELIHCNDGTVGVICSWITALQGIKSVVTLHGLDVVFPNRYFQKRLIKRLQAYDKVITVSSATKEECIKRGFDADRVDVIPNGVDHDISDMPIDLNVLHQRILDKGVDPKGKRILISMGRAVKRKGFSWFIENVLPKLGDDVLYAMIGPFKTKATLKDKLLKLLPSKLAKEITLLFGIPTDQETIRQLLQDPMYSSKIVSLGKLPFGELVSCLAASDLFIMPNINIDGDLEGFGLVALEACLSGTVVLASNTEGIRDAIIDQGNGVMVQTSNAEAWKNTIDLWLAKSNLEEYGQQFAGYTKQNYSWDKMAKGYLTCFRGMLNS